MQNSPENDEPDAPEVSLPDKATYSRPVKPEVRAAIDAWQFERNRPKRSMSLSAIAEREAYRLRQGLEVVRPYERHDHPARETHENHEGYAKRCHRDRQRAYRGHSSETVRSWTDLSEMTPEEKATHKRKLATERKRLQRYNERTDTGSGESHPLSEEDLAVLDEVLKDFPPLKHVRRRATRST